METLDLCPACHSSKISKETEVKDHFKSQETFNLFLCSGCSLLFTNPRPEENSIGNYYQSSDYISHSNTSKGLINFLYQKVRNFTLAVKTELINSFYPAKGSLLDLGCGTGHFLKAAKDNGWQVDGIEPDENARKLACTLIESKVKGNFLQEAFDGNYSIITAWHVFEHIHQIDSTLKKLKSLLKTDGKLIVAVPNYTSFDAKKYGSFWAAYDVPRHLYHFSPSAMEALLNRHGFKIITTKGMKFDSYYVSMLSEKYKSGGNLFSAFFTGLKSNMKAGSEEKKYSSVIYIAEHA